MGNFYFFTASLFLIFINHVQLQFSTGDNHPVQNDKKIGKYIELKENDRLVLKCTGDISLINSTRSTTYVNKLQKYSHVDDSKKLDEHYEAHYYENDGFAIFIINDVRQSDMDTYSCVSSTKQQIDSVYIFVFENSIFPPIAKHSDGFVLLDEQSSTFQVPCKTTKFVKNEDVELLLNDEVVKNTADFYDQRYGFQLTNEVLNFKTIEEGFATCRHKQFGKNNNLDFAITKDVNEIYPKTAKENNIQRTQKAWYVGNAALKITSTTETTSTALDQELSPIYYVIVVGLIIIFTLILIYLIFNMQALRRRNRMNDMALLKLYDSMTKDQLEPIPENIQMLPIDKRVYYLSYDSDYELQQENLELLEILGFGNFGIVRKGKLKMANKNCQLEDGSCLNVAVKSAANRYDIEQHQMLLDELIIMSVIGKHPNVLALVGAVTAEIKKGKLYLVTEFAKHGNMLDYLKKRSSTFKNELNESYMMPISKQKKSIVEGSESDMLCTSDLLSFGLQIANGMEFLAAIPCVHRDLALRNVLVTERKTIRIADFGLAKEHAEKDYYRVKSDNVKLPIRWMALESISELKFTEKSDVWSYGICLYELFTLGETPYPDIDNTEILNTIIKYLKNGERNAQPIYCHDDIYEFMNKCWRNNPNDRPNFSECVKFFRGHLENISNSLLDNIDLLLSVERNIQLDLNSWIRKPKPGALGTCDYRL